MITISTYIHFTKEQRERARRTDLANFLISQGEQVKRSGSEYEWLDGSQKVTIRGHLWYHQYEQKGGDAVDFVRRFYNKDYTEAVQMLLNNGDSQIITSPPIEKEHKPFKLPPRNDRMSRVFSYLLLTRGIDKDVLYEFVRRKMIYESSDFHNAVFVGYDSNGKPRHAHKRGTVTNNPYKGNAAGSQPEFSFHWHGTSDKIFLFEAPIVFRQITARDEFAAVQAGLQAALESGIPVKLNCVPQAGVNEGELEDLAALAENRPLQVRFIEMMPIGYGAAMPCISGPELRQRFARRWPELQPLAEATFGDGPAVYYTVPGWQGTMLRI